MNCYVISPTPASLQQVFETRHIGGIIHLAAILPTAAQRDPVRATQVNVTGSLHLLELAQRFEVKRFVFGSSLSVYGTCPADRFVSEADRAAPEDLYGAAKLYVEQLGEAYRQSHGVGVHQSQNWTCCGNWSRFGDVRVEERDFRKAREHETRLKSYCPTWDQKESWWCMSTMSQRCWSRCYRRHVRRTESTTQFASR